LKNQKGSGRITILLLTIIGVMGYSIFFLYEAFKQKDMQHNKVLRNFLILYDWMSLKQSNHGAVAMALQERGYHNIMIYGWGYLGNLLFMELENSHIKVKGILDRRQVANIYNIPIYTLDSSLPKVDAIVVTVLYDEKKIREDIEKAVSCPIINLEELI